LKWCLLRQLNRESGAGGGRTSSSHQQCARIRFQSYNEQLPNLSAQVIGLPLGLHQLDSADSHRPEQQLAFKVWRGGGGPASHDYTMRAEFPAAAFRRAVAYSIHPRTCMADIFTDLPGGPSVCRPISSAALTI
jgi:hypothetical protein